MSVVILGRPDGLPSARILASSSERRFTQRTHLGEQGPWRNG